MAEPTDLEPEQASRYWAEVLAVGWAVRTRLPVSVPDTDLHGQAADLRALLAG